METNMNRFRKDCLSITEIKNSHQMYHFSLNGLLNDLIFLWTRCSFEKEMIPLIKSLTNVTWEAHPDSQLLGSICLKILTINILYYLVI